MTESKEVQADESRNIYQRLNAVRDAVKYIRKDKEVSTGKGKYPAVTHDVVTAYCREHFITHGVMIVPNETQSEALNIGQTQNGTPVIRYEAWYEVRFVNIDKPEDYISITIESHANDSGDKAPGKALSYAVKYAMLKLLSIETGENEESRIEVARGLEPVTAEQAKEIEGRIDKLVKSGKIPDRTKFDNWMRTQLKVTRIDDLTQAEAETVEAALAKREGE